MIEDFTVVSIGGRAFLSPRGEVRTRSVSLPISTINSLLTFIGLVGLC